MLPAPHQEHATEAGDGAYKFIVQFGSFVDREQAELAKKNIEDKGYKAVVKPLKHDVLGQVYVIQLQPVNSSSKASTLMTQLGSETEGEPVILKVPTGKPAAPKASEIQVPAQ